MHHIFASNHAQLLNSCYPPAAALLTAGPDYTPNSHELSRLTYYASNHPGKLTKISAELEKRIRSEAKKAKGGYPRARAQLLISLAIFRALATECRRDVALLSPALISSIDIAFAAMGHDLEVVARLATVFTAWTTYTNGQLIGTDNALTECYLSVLRRLSDISCFHSKDSEVQNRTRLVGLAAITGALNSDALYNDSRQFKTQITILLKPIIMCLFEANMSTLNDQATTARESPGSPYLSEFRTRPALERKAASIHIHIEGDTGPSSSDVSEACLRALFSLLEHAGGVQLGAIMQSSLENLDAIQGWAKLNHCCWYAKKLAEWAQYQYRFVVPTWLVEKLLNTPESQTPTPLQTALGSMVAAVFKAPSPLINLSSSDLLSNLLTLLLRRNAISADDSLIPILIECVASLGCHIYYSDQIQDLSAEIINRISMIEVQGSKDESQGPQTRASALCHLMAALKKLLRTASEDGATSVHHPANTSSSSSRFERQKAENPLELAPRRTQVSPEIWQDTVSLLCDREAEVRYQYSSLLCYYIKEEMPKVGETLNTEKGRKINKLAEGSILQVANVNLFLNSSDVGSRFLNALHAYAFILAMHTSSIQPLLSDSPDLEDIAIAQEHPETDSPRRPHSKSGPRSRKASLQRRLTTSKRQAIPAPAAGWDRDLTNLQEILVLVQEELPIRGLLTGVPMLLHLGTTVAGNHPPEGDGKTNTASRLLRSLSTEVWKMIADTWESIPLGELVAATSCVTTFDGIQALHQLSNNHHVQEALGMDKIEVQRRLSIPWSPRLALYGFTQKQSSAFEASIRGDKVSPLLKISPALMQVENMSLQSLNRPSRGLGVSDLREALEGRNSASNPNLTRPASISTYDYTSSVTGGDPSMHRIAPVRSRTKSTKSKTGRKGVTQKGDVRDVLNKLGIHGKQNAALLKAPFSNVQQ